MHIFINWTEYSEGDNASGIEPPVSNITCLYVAILDRKLKQFLSYLWRYRYSCISCLSDLKQSYSSAITSAWIETNWVVSYLENIQYTEQDIAISLNDEMTISSSLLPCNSAVFKE